MHKILIAEDEAVIAIELERTLVAMGHEVVGRASSGEEAVDLARCFKPDMIIMDVAMPGKMDGIAAAEAIRQKLDIPVIFLHGAYSRRCDTKSKTCRTPWIYSEALSRGTN